MGTVPLKIVLKPRGRIIPVVQESMDSADIFRVGRTIMIRHGDQAYQLRLTAQNKLILTK
ncbi:hemin uptake protein HemP [Xanthobacter sp. DSM 24535]|uniref:hemin uptake protein HemP n=1 Tax=Roseixanthobacter psychrophilus TaxID=3119917 RepID=UPI00372672B1